ncbi:DNA topoisomerase III [Oceanospirillum sediminis]|uniref:DNA topoisomerase 3 n=1 Tax=Oceanospirillum sediminis TaxID=2760088 RepID=A0A839ITJ0_9GAMM|nr:DNA topoisomerase III [Oceanospirillum sediminis]MBB1487799.1 DNA topoisomerase III [Oceanospirillum sediminis]
MKLYIAEKPSLGRAIAAVLPKPHKKHDGYIETGQGDCVSWCIGHLLEQADPEAYDPALKKWQLDKLPIIPDEWQLEPKKQTRKQLTVLRKLVKQASVLVNAGDPDREGQLLVDEVISYLKVPVSKRQNTRRVLISDLNPGAVRKALNNERSNLEFVPLATSALARSRADWLYGINLTRAYTLKGQQAGYKGVLSVGRVQTPVLGLVVRRDEEIRQFQPKNYYEVLAHLQFQLSAADKTASDEHHFTAQWQPSEACLPHMDEEGRVLNKKLAEHVVTRIHDQPALVTDVEQQSKKESPPMPFNLSQLQIAANKRFGFSAQQVLDLCQALYEKHNLITYPRSDSRHLPKEQLKDVSSVIQAIGRTAHNLGNGAEQADQALVSKAWNDSKVDAHHAIIPTTKSMDASRLSAQELKLYELVARQYLAQFYPAYRYNTQQISFDIAGGLFIAKARQNIDLGWKKLFEQEPDEQHLPAMKKGDTLHCSHGELLEKQTQPPKHFTDATLLSAMTGIGRFVKDKAIKKILKDTDGLGTEATRAGIIELLFKRGFLQRQNKLILSTPAGQALINNLPESATLPDMTAHWESMLEQISQKALKYDGFMTPMQQQLNSMVEQAKTTQMSGLAGLENSNGFKKKGRRSSGYSRSGSGAGKSSGSKSRQKTGSNRNA